VRGDQQLVRLYSKGELIKTHPRVPKGKKSTDYSDYPPERAAYAMRDVNYRLAHNADHVVIEGESFRRRQRPGNGNDQTKERRKQKRG
jgi:hypothetical protein